MWRYQAVCRHCGTETPWHKDPGEAAGIMGAHLHRAHQFPGPDYASEYDLIKQRQCDYCLGAYLDDCTKCRHDFCRLHEGFIDGLCVYCI
jgi:hypothetical protein